MRKIEIRNLRAGDVILARDKRCLIVTDWTTGFRGAVDICGYRKALEDCNPKDFLAIRPGDDGRTEFCLTTANQNYPGLMVLGSIEDVTRFLGVKCLDEILAWSIDGGFFWLRDGEYHDFLVSSPNSYQITLEYLGNDPKPKTPTKGKQRFSVGDRVVNVKPGGDFEGKHGRVVKISPEAFWVEWEDTPETTNTQWYSNGSNLVKREDAMATATPEKTPQKFSVGDQVLHENDGGPLDGAVGNVIESSDTIFRVAWWKNGIQVDSIPYPHGNCIFQFKKLEDIEPEKPAAPTKVEQSFSEGDRVVYKEGNNGLWEGARGRVTGSSCNYFTVRWDGLSSYLCTRDYHQGCNFIEREKPATPGFEKPTDPISSHFERKPEMETHYPKLEELGTDLGKLAETLATLKVRETELQAELETVQKAEAETQETINDLQKEYARVEQTVQTMENAHAALVGSETRCARKVADTVIQLGRGGFKTFEELGKLCGRHDVRKIAEAAIKLEPTLRIEQHGDSTILKVKRFLFS